MQGREWGSNGDQSFTIRMVDKAGNVGAASDPLIVNVAATPPERVTFGAIATDNKVNADEYADGATFTITHELTHADYRLEIWRDGVFLKYITLAETVTSTVVTLTGAEWGTNGEHVFTARLIDGLNNLGAWSLEQTVLVDTVIPAAPTFGPITGDNEIDAGEKAATTTFVVSHEQASAGSVLLVYRDGALVKTVSVTTGATSTGIEMIRNDWGFSGDYSFTVQLRDGAGNISPASTEQVVTVAALPDANLRQPSSPLVYGISNDTAILSWYPATFIGAPTALEYIVLKDGVEVARVTDNKYEFTGLDASTTYQFSVVAVTPAGESAPLMASPVTTEEFARWDTKQFFSPYIDMGATASAEIVSIVQAAGLKAISLGFLVMEPHPHDTSADPVRELRWGPQTGESFLDDRFANGISFSGELKKLQQAGVDITVSFGGAAGREPAMIFDNVKDLYNLYQSVIDLYGVNRLEFDVEGIGLNVINPENGGDPEYHAHYTKAELAAFHKLRAETLVQMQEQNPDLIISFTVPVMPAGMGQRALDMLQIMLDEGLQIDILNIMAMDYYWPQDPGDQGRNAIDAARNTISQYRLTGLNAGTAYQITVTAINSLGESVKSDALTVTTRLTDLPDQVQDYSPIVDMSIWNRPTLQTLATNAGLTAMTLSGIVGTGSGGLTWANSAAGATIQNDSTPGNTADNGSGGAELTIKQQIDAIKSTVDVTLSFGDGSETDAALKFATASALQAGLQSAIDHYGIMKLDFNIASLQASNAGHAIRNTALVALDNAHNGDVEISFTTHVQSIGLTSGLSQVLTQAKNMAGGGVDIDVLNIMLMDYWGPAGSEEASNPDMGRYAIDMALKALEILDSVGYTDTKVGLYVKPGMNLYGQVFTVQDAAQLYEFAKDNPDIAYLGLNSLAKDKMGTLGTATQQGSGLSQTDWQFSGIFGAI